MNSLDGVYALANIRGGGEYGRKWKDDGILLNKQNGFDDFHAAAEYLIDQKYTTKSKLAIIGGSNGGLLVGACINQRPNLYGAAVAIAGVYDLLRNHLFTIQTIVIPEYGNPAEKIHFDNLLKLSPLHNVHAPNSTQYQYPSTLILSADHDDRVSPLQSYKFTAALQHAVQGNKYQKNPILMSITKNSGHGGGKPTYMTIKFTTDMVTFLYRALSIKTEI